MQTWPNEWIVVDWTDIAGGQRSKPASDGCFICSFVPSNSHTCSYSNVYLKFCAATGSLMKTNDCSAEVNRVISLASQWMAMYKTLWSSTQNQDWCARTFQFMRLFPYAPCTETRTKVTQGNSVCNMLQEKPESLSEEQNQQQYH